MKARTAALENCILKGCFRKLDGSIEREPNEKKYLYETKPTRTVLKEID